jgi:hypothetical protein
MYDDDYDDDTLLLVYFKTNDVTGFVRMWKNKIHKKVLRNF